MATVTYEAATCQYDSADQPAVDALDLAIQDGEFLVMVGPSGCGKSTSLRMLAGLEPVRSGSIRIDGREVTGLAAKDRDIAMVFQNYALYPHMTVAENMGFALRIAGVPRAERDQRVAEAARLLDLTDYLHRKPKALSGGQRQRVAMGRAIVRSPKVFCMDEPLSNLDAKLRVQTRAQIAALQRRLAVTTVYVTHDQVEAMTMGDRVAVLREGVLQQCGAPRELYDTPANVFVAGFIGSPAMNLCECPVIDGRAVIAGTAEIPVPRSPGRAGTVTIGFRPESLDLVTGATRQAFPVTVELVEELGADAFLYGRATAGGPQVVARVDPRTPPRPGSKVWLALRPGSAHFFDTVSGERWR
ncbi:carbohydrate ABC transporter ATP-binding protein, CUT1 family [Actinokineospora alba]|uniref:Carbohydrate ABC transporter ATP-binding protein, CUT1 family n=1 Tax=Actinokineospora alba TaxID=504798 RepID=A0A1H0QRY0_9PSEU|nr:sn-glycerol-3-phosphate ABC transporter ATP-binding protein UgpC [Actinokineospora alba]TDP70428.1 carbohydrate ABC transporter ATP-binding protein (CUT1 family) [Actinokineospora alba]SDI31808.1 multiple sugar transport system ATP-binding protein [Actinokineospora alba]SDP19875.1 carbohydrate ABC transporter ATP-binding protein, CUT1 family [Actinokineospora alba]